MLFFNLCLKKFWNNIVMHYCRCLLLPLSLSPLQLFSSVFFRNFTLVVWHFPCIMLISSTTQLSYYRWYHIPCQIGGTYKNSWSGKDYRTPCIFFCAESNVCVFKVTNEVKNLLISSKAFGKTKFCWNFLK